MIEVFFLNRPEAGNSLDLQTAKEMEREIKSAIKAHKAGFVIASQSSSVFCAGGDLKAYKKMKTKAAGVNVNRAITKILDGFFEAPISIVSAIEGDCIGGGCELALSCDRIVMSSTARLAFRQIHLGLTPGWGGAGRLLRRVTPQNAYDLLTTGRWITAIEALRLGLVDEVVSPGQTLDSAQEFISQQAGIPQKILALIKKMVYQESPLNGNLERKIFESLWFEKHHKEKLSESKI